MTQYNKSKIENQKSKMGSEEGAVIKHDLNNAAHTGDWRYMTPVVDKEKCIGCSTCVPYCPEACMEMASRGTQNVELESRSTVRDARYAKIDYDFCKGCGVCATVCPIKAITMKKN